MAWPWEFLLWKPHLEPCGNDNFLTFSFWRISWVGLFFHSVTAISGCWSSSGALGVLLCRLTFECLGSSSSSKLLNSGSLEMERKSFRFPAFLILVSCSSNNNPKGLTLLCHWFVGSQVVLPRLQILVSEMWLRKNSQLLNSWGHTLMICAYTFL